MIFGLFKKLIPYDDENSAKTLIKTLNVSNQQIYPFITVYFPL